jgi:hypothetical protein
MMGLYRVAQVNGEDKMVQIGNVRFPDGASGRYLVMIGGQPGGSANGVAVSLNPGDFPVDAIRVINVTPYLLNVTCNTATFNLRPYNSKVTRITGDQFGVGVKMMLNGDFEEMASGLYPINSTTRSTVFITLANAPQIVANPKATPQIQLSVLNDTPTASQ